MPSAVAENRFCDFLDIAFADAVTTGEVGKRTSQAWSDAVGANLSRDGLIGNDATTRASAGVGLIFGNLHRDRRQFNGLKSFRFRIVRPWLGGQRGMAARAFSGHEPLYVCDPIRRQHLFQMGGMIGLAAALPFRFLLFDGLGRA